MKAAVGALLLTATFAAPAAADIRVWTERDRQGEGREMRRAVRDLRNFHFDDRISSLEADEPWEVCTEPLYRGDCRIVQGVVLNLRVLGLNNRITSMRKASEEMIAELSKPPEPPKPTSQPPKPPKPKATEAATEPSPTPSVRAESTNVEPQPPQAETSKPKPKVEPSSTETAKAQPPKPEAEPPKAEPRKSSKRAADPKPADPPEPAPVTREWWEGGDDGAGGPPTLELFEKPNFEGRRVRLEQAISDLTELGQPVGSLLVRSGSWKICSKPQFRGRCRTVDASGMGVPETPLIGSLRPETE